MKNKSEIEVFKKTALCRNFELNVYKYFKPIIQIYKVHDHWNFIKFSFERFLRIVLGDKSF